VILRASLVAAVAAASLIIGAQAALAQEAGGILKIYNRDSPPSMSILEESALSTVLPMMGVFNNLVIYNQHVAQNNAQTIGPELATDWEWSERRDAAHL
jgi:peptide/nickel transport system substrate-binding protein